MSPPVGLAGSALGVFPYQGKLLKNITLQRCTIANGEGSQLPGKILLSGELLSSIIDRERGYLAYNESTFSPAA